MRRVRDAPVSAFVAPRGTPRERTEQMVATRAEQQAMCRALVLAADPSAPLGPNPRVGAVVVSGDGSVVGEGWHRGAGTDHAEVMALRAAGARARGSTVVVTLEPCNHQGRTGPCVQALIDAGVGRVVYAQADLGRVASGGGQALTQSGVDVEAGLFADEAAALNPAFTFAREAGRPFVTYKFAASLDGRVAADDGTSRWISGQESRADAHRLRAQVDAVLVGTGTALADNPSLTVRGVPAVHHAPLRVVMGLRSLPPGAAVLNDSAPTLHLRTREPAEALAALHDKGVQHVLIEGGPTVAAAFVKGELVDQVVAYLAPVLLGAGRPSLAAAGIQTLADGLSLTGVDVSRLGDDVRISGSVHAGANASTSPHLERT